LVSVAGQIGSQTDPPYTAAKAGLISFTKCAAKDFAPHGIRVNAIAPGMVQTPLNQRIWKAGQSLLPESERQDFETWGREKLRKLAPIAEWQTPEEIGAMAAYLASPHARHITGQTLNIDGGQVMHS
jgi:glucose 1-dehydrogenase/sorbitol-6-phosphate 2-dehydrogenase